MPQRYSACSSLDGNYSMSILRESLMDCKPNILHSNFLAVLLFSDGNLTLHSESLQGLMTNITIFYLGNLSLHHNGFQGLIM